MKKVKKKYSLGVLFVALMAMLFWWYLERPDEPNIVNELPSIAITADEIGDYFRPNRRSTALEPEQLVEIQGRIKEINTQNGRQTILLKGKIDKSPFVICDMQKGQEKELKWLKENDTIKVKGIFKGFLKDAVFLNCIVTYHNP